MNKVQLIAAVAKKTGLSKTEAAAGVNAALNGLDTNALKIMQMEGLPVDT